MQKLALILLIVLCGVSIVKTQRRAQPRVDYTNFSHPTHVAKQKLACNGCHSVPSKNWKAVRKDDAFPDVTEFPEHASCLNCHRQQFFARERPAPKICANCHVKAAPNDTSRYAFPSLGEAFLTSTRGSGFVSEFRVFFPHGKHSDADCGDCHQTYQPQGKSDDEFLTKPPKDIGDAFWLKKGTFKTRPITHANCFVCHNQESEVAPLPANCDTCHKPPVAENTTADFDEKLAGTIGVKDWWTLTAWRNRISAGAFRHEAHAEVKCAQCHNVTTMDTTSDATKKVAVKSCGGADGCHITATSDDGGILNYEIDQKNKSGNFVCTKCHIELGKRPAPLSHISAIPKPTKG